MHTAVLELEYWQDLWGKKEELETEPEHPTLYVTNQPFLLA